MSILAIHCTPRPDSRTKRLFDAYVGKLSGDVTIRDISMADLPMITSAVIPDFFSGGTSSEFSKLSAELLEEIKGAEQIVIAAPLYNFAAPAAVKAYVDLVTIAGHSFQYTEEGPVGLLPIKKAIIIATSGGVPFGSPADFMTPYLKTIIGFWAEGEVEFTEITAEALNYISDEEADAKIDELVASI